MLMGLGNLNISMMMIINTDDDDDNMEGSVSA